MCYSVLFVCLICIYLHSLTNILVFSYHQTKYCDHHQNLYSCACVRPHHFCFHRCRRCIFHFIACVFACVIIIRHSKFIHALWAYECVLRRTDRHSDRPDKEKSLIKDSLNERFASNAYAIKTHMECPFLILYSVWDELFVLGLWLYNHKYQQHQISK